MIGRSKMGLNHLRQLLQPLLTRCSHSQWTKEIWASSQRELEIHFIQIKNSMQVLAQLYMILKSPQKIYFKAVILLNLVQMLRETIWFEEMLQSCLTEIQLTCNHHPQTNISTTHQKRTLSKQSCSKWDHLLEFQISTWRMPFNHQFKETLWSKSLKKSVQIQDPDLMTHKFKINWRYWTTNWVQGTIWSHLDQVKLDSNISSHRSRIKDRQLTLIKWYQLRIRMSLWEEARSFKLSSIIRIKLPITRIQYLLPLWIGLATTTKNLKHQS